MKAKWLPLSAVVALALSSAAASAVDFHGYARAGMQASTQGGEVYCLGNGTNGHKVGRLGDECDTFAEFVFSQEVYNKANNKFTINSLIAYGTNEVGYDNQGNAWQGVGGEGPWDDQRTSLRELWAGYTTDAGYTIWSGKRYYQRKDIHLWDFYYLNNSAYGAGIENISAGNLGKLNFAVTKGEIQFEKVGDDKYRRNTYELDVRWNSIPVGFGTLDAAVIYAIPLISDKQVEAVGENKSNTVKNSGALITLDHASDVTTDSVSLMNHFIVQYGTNGYANVGTFGNHAGDNYAPDTDVQGVRAIDWGTFDAGNFGLGYAMLWAHINSGEHHGDTDAWNPKRSGWEYAVTLRPEYKWTDFTRTTLEMGYSKMKAMSGDENPDVYKFTLAQQFTPGKGFWQRPAIRFYVSYIGGDQFADVYKNKNKDEHEYQVTFGTQVEAWW